MIATHDEILTRPSIEVSRYRRRSQNNRYSQNLLAVIQPRMYATPKQPQLVDPLLHVFLRVAV
jgi:hypothetical protein